MRVLVSLLMSLALAAAYAPASSRRAFLQAAPAAVAAAAVVASQPLAATAAPEILTTSNGKIKYAIVQPAKEKSLPQTGDIVAIEYTGYLTNGQIFDATHAVGKKNALAFALGGNAVIDGINEVVREMGVGEKVQAIIPSDFAFGDKGICIESGECLIPPKSTLVYDIFLKRSAIPPP
jgi:FKBP-type peptidyl-prolyl cis-trans isomerase